MKVMKAEMTEDQKFLQDWEDGAFQQTLPEKVLEHLWKLRCKMFGRPKTFVSKEGVCYYRGPQEVLMSEHHRKEWDAHNTWKAHPDRIKQNLDVVKLERAIEEKQKREMEWARRRDEQFRVTLSAQSS